MSETGRRPMRADARRNRTKILAAARDQITSFGPEVGMDEIAAAAGVAVGTLYGHFPTKIALVAAVVSEFLAQVADRSDAAAEAVRAGSPAFDEFRGLLRDIVIAAATNQAAKAAAGALGALGANEGDAREMQRAQSAIESIIDQSRQDKTVRADLSINDFYLVVSHIPAGQPVDVLDRWVDLILTGIATTPDH